jgi:ComF family protein
MMNILLDLLFPPRCANCEIILRSPDSTGFCENCCASVRYLKAPLCRLCGMDFGGDARRNHLCGQCLISDPPFSYARSIVYYEAAVRELLQRLKYQADMTVEPALRGMVAGVDLTLFRSCEAIIPVPLHLERLRGRGFNQSLFLARVIFADCRAKIVPDVLKRIKNTTSQTGLSGKARRKNLRNAFQVTRGKNIRGCRVCLVDDVFTTGTTVSECSRTLIRGGALEVRVVTLARTRV